MKNMITTEEKKQLFKAQQGELDAVLIYRKLGELVKDELHKETFLKVAKDEGKHAAILKKYTGEVLQPKKTKALLIATIYRLFGLKKTLQILSDGEYKAAKGYIALAEKHTDIKEIMQDEKHHGDLMKDLIK